jgi:hypothetical protein
VTREQAAQRRLGGRVTAWMAVFLVLNFATAASIEALKPGPFATAALLLLPLAPLAGALWSTLAHHRRNADELEQRIELQSATLTVGVLLLTATFWGFLERHLAVPRFPLDMSMPLAVLVWAAIRAMVTRGYR